MADSYIYITSKPIVAEPPPESLVTSTITEQNIIVNIDDQLGAGSDRFQGLFKHNEDFYSVTDTRVLSPNKGKTDYLNLSDTISTFGVALVKKDIPVTLDTNQKLVVKAKLDTTALSDRPFKLLSKPFSDLSTATDRPFKLIVKNTADNTLLSDITVYFVEKRLSDVPSVSDQLSTVWTIVRYYSDISTISDKVANAVIKRAFDNTLLSDVNYNHTGKFVTDPSSVTDVFARTIAYDRVFSDFAIGTDDIFGNADIDDQQVAAVVKSVVNFTQLIDVFDRSIIFNRSFVNNTSTTDFSHRGIGKNFNDFSSLTDSLDIDVSFNRTFEHTSVIFDAKSVDFLKELSIDYSGVTDKAFLNPIKALSNLSELTDINRFDATKSAVDTALLSDKLATDSGKTAQDSASLSEIRVAYQQNYFQSADYAQYGYTGQIHSI